MPKGFVVVDHERCKGCGLCVVACPFGVLEMSATYNSSGYAVAAPVHLEKCTGCALCALTCPDVAIEVYRERATACAPVGSSAGRQTGSRADGANDA